MRIDQGINAIPLEEEMKQSYLDYAMSVIVSRALPDVRDGLKPVHRRILFSMKESGYDFNRPHRKSARIVGDVIGKYHPHGDTAIYDALVRMAQDFSLRVPLIDGQGNFGSMDGDSPAAMRYTEARLSRAAHYLLEDIDKETVEFEPNYDNSLLQPKVLPASIPNLLINGAGGIAVGMATNIPTHNLGETIDATIALIDNPHLTVEELIQIVPGPDFATGGLIIGRAGIFDAYRTGRGSVIMRGRTNIETNAKDRQAIIITEIPYQVNKAKMVERIAEVVREKIIEGISDLRDESDREGVRVVVELKRDANADVVLNQLYRHTQLQTSFGVNMLALLGGRPLLMNLKDILKAFIDFREEVTTRRKRFELKQALGRAHILLGLVLSVSHIDEVIQLIRNAQDPADAKEKLMKREWPMGEIRSYIALIDGDNFQESQYYRLSDLQAKAILDLRLHRLTGLEQEKVIQELDELSNEIREILRILGSREFIFDLIKKELLDMKQLFATPRKTTIEIDEFEHDIEALIQQEEMVVTISMEGYIKRVPIDAYRSQRRGGKGRSGMATREEDEVQDVFVVNTHTPLLFFSTLGRAYQIKVYRLPLGSPQSRGKAMVNLLPLGPGEKIATVMPLPVEMENWEQMHILFATSRGNVRRNALSDFLNIRSNGKKAITLDEGEQLIGVKSCTDQQDIFLATRSGRAIRFPVHNIRVFSGRDSNGVRGIKLQNQDEVVSMAIINSVQATPEERAAYIRYMNQLRRQQDSTSVEENTETFVAEEGEENIQSITLSNERITELQDKEQFILTLTERGFGKRTSSYEYRVANRGGLGIANMGITAKNGSVVASFPIGHGDQLVLLSDAGTIIRCPVHGVRICGRNSQGVIIFRMKDDEKLVSSALLPEDKISSVEEEDDIENEGEALISQSE